MIEHPTANKRRWVEYGAHNTQENQVQLLLKIDQVLAALLRVENAREQRQYPSPQAMWNYIAATRMAQSLHSYTMPVFASANANVIAPVKARITSLYAANPFSGLSAYVPTKQSLTAAKNYMANAVSRVCETVFPYITFSHAQ